MGGKEGSLSLLVEDNNTDARQTSYYYFSCEVPMTGGNRTGNDVERTAIIREFLLDIGLSQSSFPRDLSKVRGYLRGRQ